MAYVGYNMGNKARQMFVVITILIASAIVVSAGTETQLTQDELLTSGIAAYGNQVFWTETAGNDVHAYNLTTGERTNISGHSAHSRINAYGEKVVWTGDDGDSVYIYDFSTGNETMIASERRSPDICGNYIVYTNNYYYGQEHENDGIYLYDLNTHNETKIATVYSSPAVYGEKVVWSQKNGNNSYDVYLHNISTQEMSIIATTNSSIPEHELDICGNVVVWIESGNVYMYNISSDEKTQVTDNGSASQPAIYGNWITYAAGDPYRGDIYVYEISTARTASITTSTFAFSPSIYGDKIVYADIRNPETAPDVRDIYLYDLSNTSNSIAANFTGNITSGNTSLNVSFTDISDGAPDTWHWDFGDGAISREQNPVHTFLSAGNYTVCLTVSNANDTDSKLATINVSENL